MENLIIDPAISVNKGSSSTTVRITDMAGLLFVSGQTAFRQNDETKTVDMRTQLQMAITNLEEVITEAGYVCENIIRLYVYTTSTDELLPHFSLILNWMEKYEMKQASAIVEVLGLVENFTVELEATVIK